MRDRVRISIGKRMAKKVLFGRFLLIFVWNYVKMHLTMDGS